MELQREIKLDGVAERERAMKRARESDDGDR
jgi:hypothetical protein